MFKKKTIPRFLSFLLIPIAFGMGSCVCFAQLTKEKVAHYRTVDSLQILLKSAKPDTNKVNILNALCLESKKESPENAIQYGQRALTLSQLLSFKKGSAKAFANMALVYKASNEFEKALEYYSQSLQLQYELADKREIIKTLSSIADLYKDQWNLAKAMEYYLNALTLYEEILTYSIPSKNQDRLVGEKKQQGRLIYVIGKLCQNQNNYEGSLKYFSRALKLFEEINDETSIADVSISFATVYYERSNHDKTQTFVFKGTHTEALDYALKARKIYQKNKSQNGIMRADNLLAYISAGRKEFGPALEYAFEALKISKEIKDDDMTATLFGTIGDIYYSQNNFNKSLEYLERCYKGATVSNNKPYIRDLYLSFASVYAKLNNYKKAYEFQTLYGRMKDALLNAQSNKQIAEMSVRYESEKKDKELIKKDAELEKQQAKTEHQQIQKNAFIAGFALVLLLAFFIFRGYRNKQKANVSITQQKEEIEKSYENISILGDIEQKITSSLSVEKIIEKVYENVNKLMVADVFCIGIHNKKNNSIDFPGFIENGQRFNSSYNLNDETRFPVLCFNNGQEIFINDLEKEYKKYISYIPIPVAGERPESLIYLPLFSKEKVIGVITVESFKKNSYTNYHLNILKNLAVYVAIALENAQLYENLEEKINERTLEVMKQKEEVEKSYENTKLLSNIGREISAVLTVEEIINKVYENVNKLMDASAFGIAVFNETEKRLDFSGFIEKGEKLPFFYNELSDERRPGIWCFKNQKEFVTNDLKRDYTSFFPGKTMPFTKEGAHAASLIYLPLSTPKKQIGVITVQSFKENAYSEYQLDILRNLAVYAVNALENAHLYQNMEEEVKYRTQEVIKQKEELEISRNNISVLSEIGQEITSSLSVEKIIEKVYENVNKLMDASIFTIGIYDEEKKRIEFVGIIENGQKIPFQSVEIGGNDQLPSICFNERKIIFINNFGEEYKKYFPEAPTPIAGLASESIIYIPLIIRNKPIGVITVQSTRKNAFTEYHLNILQSMAVYSAIAIENAQLYENLEEKVIKRTEEVLKQKEEVEKSYQNTKLLSGIGREITAVLSVEEIINKVYENVNKLMDAAIFGIGTFNKTENKIEFKGVIEKGEKLPIHYEELKDEGRPTIWCFKNQKELFTNDYKKDYANFFPGRTMPSPTKGEHAASIIYLPLSTANKQIGVITVQSFRKNAYTEYQLDILRNLAVYVVNAMENAHLYQNMEEEVKYRTQEVIKQKEEIEISHNNINVLSEIGQQLTSTLDFESIFIKLHESINRLMDAETFGVRIFNSEKNTLEIKYEYDKGERVAPLSFSMDNDDNYSIWCIKNKKEIFINDNLKEYKKYVKKIIVVSGEMTSSLLFCPLIFKDAVIGVITVQSYVKNRYTKHHLDILRTLANYTAIALENAQLYENLEEKVQERTIEVLNQKEEVEKSYENTKLLSKIGMEVTAILSVEEIINRVYENVNKLMDATAFGIGIFNEGEKRLEFAGFTEKGVKLPLYYNELSDENRPAVWCFKRQKEMFINDFRSEFPTYFPGRVMPLPKAGEMSESIIYLPLSTANKQIGVITVQSFKKNAYTEYHLNILRNLALYVVNGLENARMYENMEEEVIARTVEIEKQKDELARLSIVASETDNGVLIFGATGEIEWVNAGFTRLQGYDIDELKQRGNSLEKISNNPGIRALVQGAMENKKSSIYQSLNITKDGKELWVQSSLTPILDDAGNIKNWVVVDTDVTDRKNAEDALRLQNEKIYDSINYAKRIQEALLPPIEEINKLLPESFVLYKPKDIVSGDFYWIYKDKERVLIAVVDCTGHGVPGAFMSLMGNNLLNDIVKVKGKYTPSEILFELNIQIINTLKQNSKNTSVKFGMDIALVSLEFEKPKSEKGKSTAKSEKKLPASASQRFTKLQYAGAHSPLLIYRGDECIEIKADKNSIGFIKKIEEQGFTNHSFELKKGDMLYLFSDGYADQIGGQENKKIFAQPFRDILQSVCQLEMQGQNKTLDEILIDWTGNHNQTDDILVIGIRV